MAQCELLTKKLNRMEAIEFLKNKGITKATCYTDSSKTYYVNELAELMEEYAALRQPLVISSVCDHPEEALIRDKPTPYCLACNKNIPEQTDL
mgnify:CR=1 FL=1